MLCSRATNRCANLRKGVITALVTPLSKDGSLCEDCLKQLFEFQLSRSIRGFYIGGTYGEGVILPSQVKLKLFEKALEYAPSGTYLLPHVGTASIDAVIEVGKKVRDLGYEEISIIAPLYHKPTKKGLVDFFDYVSSKIDAKIVLYNNPGRQGYNITPDDFQTIIERVKTVTGIKDTSRDVEQLLEYVKRFGEKYFIAGAGDSMLYYTFAIGAPAHVCGISNLVPELAVALYESVIHGNHKKALELQYIINKLRKVLGKLSGEGQEAIRELLKYRGVNPGYPPIQMVHDFDAKLVEEARRVLEQVLESAKVL